MASLDYTYVPYGTSGIKRTKYPLPYGGVRLDDGEGITPAGKCKSLVNINPENGRIESRYPQMTNLFDFAASGTLHGSTNEPGFDAVVFHVGTALYVLKENESEPICVYESLPDKNSLMCSFMSKLYIYCDSRIFSLDENLVVCEEEPTPVLLYVDVPSASASGGTRLDVPLNGFAPRISVNYKSSTIRTYIFPATLDLSRPYQVYRGGSLLDGSEYEITEHSLVLAEKYNVSPEKEMSITYYMKNPEEEGYERGIEGCSLVCTFGGNASGGTRLFFTGNPEKKGVYYKGEFQNPLYCAADNFETIGDGSSNITALIKMYGSLIIFTDSAVYKMSYSLTDDGPFFSTKQISDYVGCDSPGSLQLIDNRAVFLNSKKGVFIVDSTDEAGEHNIKPLSGNVLCGSDLGILDLERTALKNASSCDYDRKYMLFAGSRAFVWDYDKTAFYENGSYSKAQERLCWYIYDGIEGEKFCRLGTSLLSFSCKDDKVTLNEFLKSPTDGTGTECILDTGNIEAFGDGKRRFVTGMGIKLSRSDKCGITVTFIADGREYYRKTVHNRVGAKEKIFFPLPKKALYSFGFRISAKDTFAIDFIEIFSREISG